MANASDDKTGEDIDGLPPQGIEFEVYPSDGSPPVGSIRVPKSCPPENCKTVRISLVAMMVISAIVPFVVITCMHIAYALSCPSQYTAGRAAGMIILNVLCILPFISWFSFVALFIWLVIMFARRAKDNKCSEMMKKTQESILERRSTYREDSDFVAGKHRKGAAAAAPADTGKPRAAAAADGASSGSSRSIELESNSSHLSSLLDESSQVAVSESSTSMPDQDAATTSSFDSSFSESSLNDFTPHWRSPL